MRDIGNFGNSDHATIEIDLLVICDRPENVKMKRLEKWRQSRAEKPSSAGAMEPPTRTTLRIGGGMEIF